MPKVTNPVTGETAWASEAGAEVLRRRFSGEQDGAGTVERPDSAAPRGDWDAYATSIGLSPEGFRSKRALIAAIDTGRCSDV